MGFKKGGKGPPTPTLKKKNETPNPVHIDKCTCIWNSWIESNKKGRGGGKIGRCCYHHFAGKTAGNVKEELAR